MNRFTSYLLRYSCILFVGLLFANRSEGQVNIDSILHKIDPQKLATSIQKKSEEIQQRLVKKSMKVLDKFQREEEKIYSKLLGGKDSVLAKVKLDEVRSKYTALKSKLKIPGLIKVRQFIPRLDSLHTALKFLDANGIGNKVKDALAKSDQLKSKLQHADEIRRFIKERREQLQMQLEKLGIVKKLKQLNKQVYYYAAQLKEYKAILNDPTKIEKKALELLSKTKLFQNFFKKHSMLAGMFRLPGNPGDPAYLASLNGLQTRSQVQGIVRQQIRNAGPNGAQAFQQQIQAAQSRVKELQTKILKHGGSSSEDIIPEGFKPNMQKTKSFLERFEYGTNFQTQKGNSLWPNNADIALSVGYKLNDKSVIGLGASYKLGLGRGFQHLKLSSEGLGLRSYIDWNLKKLFWLTGGFEMNYKSAINSVDALKDFNAWQRSGLLGLSKSVPVKTKFFKGTKVQLLWDFLSNQQVPKTQSIIFRVGYTFK